jgi:hypothetical protein
LAPPAGASAAAQRGFGAWRVHCQKCHMLNGDGGEIGPELNWPMNVTEYWQPNMLKRWVLDPASMRLPAKMPPINPALDPALGEKYPRLEELNDFEAAEAGEHTVVVTGWGSCAGEVAEYQLDVVRL